MARLSNFGNNNWGHRLECGVTRAQSFMSKWTETPDEFNNFWALHRELWNLETLTQIVKIKLKNGSEVEGFIRGGATDINVDRGKAPKTNGNVHIETTSGRLVEIDLMNIDRLMRRL